MAADNDLYYVPPHLSAPFSAEEVARYVAVFGALDADDGDANGFVEGDDQLDAVMRAVGETPTAAKRAELLAECDGSGTGDLAFLDVLRLLARFKFRRDPFGGKRTITDDLPLPSRVATEYDVPCMQRPERRAQMADATDPAMTVLRTVFNRHDADGSGEIDMGEVVAILEENNVAVDEEQLEGLFQRFDVDKSGTLDLGEFSELLADLKADAALVRGRAEAYALPPHLGDKFDAGELAELKINFGMFDADGSGSVASHELKQVLEELGHAPTEAQVKEVVALVDDDGSGEIDFGEFAALMLLVKAGTVPLGALAAAVLDSAGAQRLAVEVGRLTEARERGPPQPPPQKPPGRRHREDYNDQGGGSGGGGCGGVCGGGSGEEEGAGEDKEEADEEEGEEGEEDGGGGDPWYVPGLVSIEVERQRPHCCTALLAGPHDSPYEGRGFELQIELGDDYPYACPTTCRFSHRVLHANFSLALDGTTTMPQLLQYWDAEWNLAKLLRYVRGLMKEPNLGLLPPDYATGTRHDPLLAARAHHHPRHDHDHGHLGGEDGHGGGGGDHHSPYGAAAAPEDDDSYPYDELPPMAGPPAVDLRRQRSGNRFLAELVHLYCEERPRYDANAKEFSAKHGKPLPLEYDDDDDSRISHFHLSSSWRFQLPNKGKQATAKKHAGGPSAVAEHPRCSRHMGIERERRSNY